MHAPCDCIVPFYNEGERIIAVIRALSRVPSINRIICVDDGSTDGAYKVIKQRFPDVLLIRCNNNSGKAVAIRLGLGRVQEETVLLFDGDLLYVVSEEIDRAIGKFFTTPALDMLILKAQAKNWHIIADTIFRSYIIQSGLRVLQTKDLREIVQVPLTGYQIEVAINQYMMEMGKSVAWYPISALNLHKTDKFSFVEGWKRDLAMDREIMSYLGPIKRLQQIFFFCRRRLV